MYGLCLRNEAHCFAVAGLQMEPKGDQYEQSREPVVCFWNADMQTELFLLQDAAYQTSCCYDVQLTALLILCITVHSSHRGSRTTDNTSFNDYRW